MVSSLLIASGLPILVHHLAQARHFIGVVVSPLLPAFMCKLVIYPRRMICCWLAGIFFIAAALAHLRIATADIKMFFAKMQATPALAAEWLAAANVRKAAVNFFIAQ